MHVPRRFQSYPEPYADRVEAGDVLAGRLLRYADRTDVLVLALPRGGVPVAHRVAAALNAPLDVIAVRKIGLPDQPELAMGAIAIVGDVVDVVRNEYVIRRSRASAEEFEAVRRREDLELRRRQAHYRGDRGALSVRGRIVIVVDDGLATGSTMRAAVAALKPHRPARIVVAAPIGSLETCAELGELVDEVVCVRMPVPFIAVGEGYRDFSPTRDDEVQRLLDNTAD